ncbi:uncharacterized protein LOC130976127 [Arachis stenosperma]|uniref:uncharacterized protein LOC130976127 n=1 Tax=Arachis stenosperma TaxID=217475 RepID=UPI0025AD6777|nr:uncharacterized protein LOC130976127 [Arachis stenosperma]
MHGETIAQLKELLDHDQEEPVEKSPLHDMLTEVFGIDDHNYEGEDDEPFASRTDSVSMSLTPENNIDIFLQPFFSELDELWRGVNVYDNIDDTSLDYPSCNFDTVSRRLKFGMKYCFMGYRQWLPDNHEYRNNKHSFDGHTELRGPPPTLSGRRILSQIESSRKRPQDALNDGINPLQWKNRSIFWDLPYWKDNLIRYCLDMMHIEKNVCDNIIGLKSHDSHIIMEHILPIALRRSLPKEVTSMLIELCNYFREVSGKSLSLENLDRLRYRIVLTLCHMEMIFPPAFFTILVHLVIDLVEEAMVADPVQYIWMYPVERVVGHLKSCVHNKDTPKGCIVEGYIIEECLTFYSKYLEDDNIETRFNRPRCNDDQNDNTPSSCSTVTKNDDLDVTPEIKWLAEGLNDVVKRFGENNVRGFKFCTMKKEQGLKIQNSDVVMSAITHSFSNDRNPVIIASNNTYYGKVVDIIELDNFSKLEVVLFKCIWVDTTLNKGIKIDKFGITFVNFSNLIHTSDNEIDEPFILATDARMVYYVDDLVDEGWCSVCRMKPRDLYDMGDLNEEELDESLMEDIPFCEQQVDNLQEFQLTKDKVNEPK